MTMEWWRSWHGAPTDHKWAVIANRAGVKVGIVSAVAWALLDYASQNNPRGSIEGFDTETYAVYSGFDEREIVAVIQAMTDKGVIKDGRLSNWEKRQPKREDDSNARVNKHREMKRNVTQGNAEVEVVTFDSVSVSPLNSNDLDEIPAEEPETGAPQFRHLSAAFETTAGILMNNPSKWIAAVKEIESMGGTPDDIREAIRVLREKNYTILGPWSIVNTIRGNIGKRNGKLPAVSSEDYYKGWELH